MDHAANRPGDDDVGDAGPSHGARANDEWSQRAGFSLWLDVGHDDHGNDTWRARIYHEETGEETVVGSAFVGELLTWMLPRVGVDTPPGRRRAEADDRPPLPTAGLSVDVAEIRIVGRRNDAATDREHLRLEAELVVRGMTNLQTLLGAAMLRSALGGDLKEPDA